MSFPSDLYEYPDSHVGRKTFVSVQGHDRSVPKYKTYKGLGERNYILTEYGGDFSCASGGSHTLLPDKLENLSPIDGSYVTSRSTHREHMRRHGVEEAGDIKMGSMSRDDRAPMGRVAPDIIRSIEELRSR